MELPIVLIKFCWNWNRNILCKVYAYYNSVSRLTFFELALQILITLYMNYVC